MNQVLEQFERLGVQDNDSILQQCFNRHPMSLSVPLETLLQLVRETKSVIAGSFILDCILGTTFAADVDVFAHHSTQETWFRCIRLGRESKGGYGDLSHITAIFRNCSLNVIFCNDVSACIASFDLSLCRASYNGYQFENHQQVSTRHMRIEQPFTDNAATTERRLYRILKYHERGFIITNTVALANLAYQKADRALPTSHAFMLLMSRFLTRPDMFIP